MLSQVCELSQMCPFSLICEFVSSLKSECVKILSAFVGIPHLCSMYMRTYVCSIGCLVLVMVAYQVTVVCTYVCVACVSWVHWLWCVTLSLLLPFHLQI